MSLDIKGQVFNSWTVPAKAGETVKIKIGQSLKHNGNNNELLDLTGPKEVSLVVQGPQLTIDPSDILGVYPAPGSEDSPDEYFPHIALAGRTLPWERKGPKDHLPWMALLLIAENELAGGARARRTGGKLIPKPSASGKVEPTTVGKIKASDLISYNQLHGVLKLPDSAQFLSAHIPNKLLQAIMPVGPNIDLLSLLCHGKRTMKGLEEQDASIIISNRLPDASNQVSWTALLVSLEQRSDLLDPNRFSNINAATVFIVLHKWSFKPSKDGDFEQVMKLLRIRPNGGVLRFGNLPRTVRPGGKAPLSESFQGLLDKDGYFLESFPHDMSAEQEPHEDVAFRSPLRPFPPPARANGFAVRAAPEEFADVQGQVDYSHAAAFELGRLLALADATVLEELRNIHAAVPDRIVDEKMINPLPDALQKPDWVVNPQWVDQPWNMQQNAMIRPETELTKSGIADYSGIEQQGAIWKQTVVNQVSAISTPVSEPVDQIDIGAVTAEDLAKKFGKMITAANF